MSTDDAGDAADEAARPNRPRSVKRGAFPTPKSEIEKAKVFVPPTEEADDGPQSEAERPATDPDDPESRTRRKS